jgi:hypothetical protein
MAAEDKEYGLAATQLGSGTPSRSGHVARRSHLRPDRVRRRGLMNSPGYPGTPAACLSGPSTLAGTARSPSCAPCGPPW